MRKITFLACAAMMLASACFFTACKKDKMVEELQEEQGSYNGEVVKTQFAISLPNQVKAQGPNRMPGTTVPENGVFKGMKNIALIPFAKEEAIASGDTRLGAANIGLDPITSGLSATGNAKVYENVSIPLTTASFLVYAEATAAAEAGSTDATKHSCGYLKQTGISDGATNGITFDLAPVLGTSTLDDVYADTRAANLLALLNAVANAEDSNSKKWKEYVAGTDDAGMAALFDTYNDLYTLSSFGVLRLLSDWYKSVEPLRTGAADPVKTLAASIQTAIKTGIDVTGDGSVGDPFVFVYKANYDGFPENLNLPAGSVRLKYEGGAFVKCAANEYPAHQTAPTLFVYPTSLWYYANSQIKTANESKKTLMESNKAWATIISEFPPSAPAAVNSLTRSVAIIDPIQYAVARLDVKVKLAATTLKDYEDQDIAANASGFPVSAVFVGNQRQLKFDFTPKAGETKYTIYDNALTDINATDSWSAINSTLVLETPASTAAKPNTDANADVQIAIELTNNTGQDFKGANGQLIPNGGKFYLVGTMIASKAETETGKKVFKQDYKTIAQLNIANLKHAYNEIPDLRTPELELGLSVDLNWQAGFTYDIDL